MKNFFFYLSPFNKIKKIVSCLILFKFVNMYRQQYILWRFKKSDERSGRFESQRVWQPRRQHTCTIWRFQGWNVCTNRGLFVCSCLYIFGIMKKVFLIARFYTLHLIFSADSSPNKTTFDKYFYNLWVFSIAFNFFLIFKAIRNAMWVGEKLWSFIPSYYGWFAAWWR